MIKIDRNDQPSNEIKLATLAGNKTGWDCAFTVPAVCTAAWSNQDWITFIGFGWFRTEVQP